MIEKLSRKNDFSYIATYNRRRMFLDDSDSDSSTLNFVRRIQREQLEIIVNEKFELFKFLEHDCDVCLEIRPLTARACCNYHVCNECLSNYIAAQVNEKSDKIIIECLNCDKFMSTTEIRLRLKYSTFNKEEKLFMKRLHEASIKRDQYLCPNCGTVLNVKKSSNLKHERKYAIENECNFCGFKTCSRCRSPLHEGIKCKDYIRGDKSMVAWAKGDSETRMATKCPGCKRWFQKSDGCDHMTCSHCNTQFYYSCGCRYYENIPGIGRDILGSHSSKLGVLGCRENFLKGHPVIRKTIRGGVLAGVVTVAAPVAVPIGAVVGGGFIVGYAWYRAGKGIRNFARKRTEERCARRRERMEWDPRQGNFYLL